MKRYDKEFKEQALRLSDDIGVKKASEQLGIVYGTLTKSGLFSYICTRMNKTTLSVRQACNCLSVSECGYYKWKRNHDRPKAWQFLLRQIHTILDEHTDNDNYGVQRMKLALVQRGIKRSYATVKRAMLKGNLLHDSTRSRDGVTKTEKNVMRPENVIQRNFMADEPNRKWLTDITQVVCRDGKLYIAPVFDCFGGEVVSLAMDTKMSKQLCNHGSGTGIRQTKAGQWGNNP